MHLHCLLKLHNYLHQSSVFSCGFKLTVLGYRHFPWSAFSSQVGHTFLFLWYFVLPPFEETGLPFWVPGILHQRWEVVLWKLLHIQMMFWCICRGESNLPILFLRHLEATSHTFLFPCVSHNLSLKLDILSNIFQNTGYGSPPISAACVFAIIVCFFNDLDRQF